MLISKGQIKRKCWNHLTQMFTNICCLSCASVYDSCPGLLVLCFFFYPVCSSVPVSSSVCLQIYLNLLCFPDHLSLSPTHTPVSYVSYIPPQYIQGSVSLCHCQIINSVLSLALILPSSYLFLSDLCVIWTCCLISFGFCLLDSCLSFPASLFLISPCILTLRSVISLWFWYSWTYEWSRSCFIRSLLIYRTCLCALYLRLDFVHLVFPHKPWQADVYWCCSCWHTVADLGFDYVLFTWPASEGW